MQKAVALKDGIEYFLHSFSLQHCSNNFLGNVKTIFYTFDFSQNMSVRIED